MAPANKSYHKPDKTIQYIDKNSNNFRVTKQLPASIDNTDKLVYHSPIASYEENKNKKQQKQDVLWLNPSYGKNCNKNRSTFVTSNRYSFPKKPHL